LNRFIFKTYELKTEVLAASLRNARQAREAALSGAHIATLPLYVIRDLIDHYKTKEGMASFIRDIIPEYVELLK
jgi:transaldolase